MPNLNLKVKQFNDYLFTVSIDPIYACPVRKLSFVFPSGSLFEKMKLTYNDAKLCT